MRVHYLQHVPFEGIGSIGPWLKIAGHQVSCSRLYASPELPPLAAFDALIAMGGPMSVNDELELPWLAPEKHLVREAVSSGMPVLGICLGAQLIASSLGARVYRNAEREIGWFPIEGIARPENGLFRFPGALRAFHWHGETFELPPGATLLARSEACENQAFQIGKRAVGLQFHLETTPSSARALCENCRNELRPGRFVQDESAILAAGPETYATINGEMGRLLSFLFGDE
jgi:GMP synthase-like glutamine amidotransferase